MNTLSSLFLFVSPIQIFTVIGSSMEPTFYEGERVIVMKFLQLKKGDVAAVRDPRNGRMLLKRIINIEHEKIFIEGDNKKESTDSRQFGWISKDLIVGKVLYLHS